MKLPVLGFDPDDIDDCLRVAWRDRTVIATLQGGILGDPAQWAEEQAAQETKEAFEEEIRTLHENVILLDDYRR
jgi:hypothetical protein